MIMRKKIVAGNWRMNTTVPEGEKPAEEIINKFKEVPTEVNLIIAPPSTHLASVYSVIGETNIGLSAQNCADHDSGAYTGEVSALMLSSIKVGYVILGPTETRNLFEEPNAFLV